jgi:hypothetical protein
VISDKNASPGVDPIRNIICQRPENARSERRPQQGQHYGPVGAKKKAKLVVVIEVSNHGDPTDNLVFVAN